MVPWVGKILWKDKWTSCGKGRTVSYERWILTVHEKNL